MRDILVKAYLDWLNNYATVALYAEHNGLTEDQAHKLLALAQNVYNCPHPEA